MATHNTIGKSGEEYAEKILRQKGYNIDAKNWRLGHLEIDIVASNKEYIVFVEVKTRTSTFGMHNPEEYVDKPKRSRMVIAANAYIKYYKVDKKPRFDIIGLLMNPITENIEQCNHLENAFSPPLRTISSASYSGRWKKYR